MATNALPAGSRGGNPTPRFRPPPGLHSRPKPAGRMSSEVDVTDWQGCYDANWNDLIVQFTS